MKVRCSAGTTGERRRFLEIVGASHDFGKATSFFQSYVRGLQSSSRETSHAPISGLACYRALRNDGFSKRQSFAGLLAVDRHHAQLGNVSGNGSWFEIAVDSSRREFFETQANDLEDHADSTQMLCDEVGLPLTVENFAEWISSERYLKEFLTNVYRDGQLILDTGSESACSVIESYARLVSSDKIDAAQYQLPDRCSISETAVESYVQQEFDKPDPGSLDYFREEARKEARTAAREVDLSESLLELTLPTGLGKTLTSLDAALVLRNRIESVQGVEPRIVYTVPYTSIIDQNFDVYESVLTRGEEEEVGPRRLLKHHYLSDSTHVTERSRDPDQDADRAMLLTERWESEIIATTFVQFLESLVVPSNEQSMKLPNLEHAVVLMDEVQAIPARYWDVVREVLEILGDRLNCTFVAMSATQPGLLDGTPLVGARRSEEKSAEPVNSYFDQLDRVTFNFDDSLSNAPIDHETLADRVSEHAQSEPDDDLLVVCNTIDSARRLFEELEETNSLDDTSLVYLSSAVRPKDRRRRIERLRSSTEDRFVVVSTQVVEAGVDIDMDIVWRDFAPFDSIVQAAGRCNREWNADSQGSVTVVSLQDEDGNRPARAIYDDARLHATRQTIVDHASIPYSAAEYKVTGELVDQYFDLVEEVKETDESLRELKEWQFEDARITLIEDALSVEIFVAKETDAGANEKPKAFTAMQEAVANGDQGAVARSKPDFYDNVVTVRIYSETSDRATDVQSLPLPDTDLGTYYLNANSDRYDDWYDENTGFMIPESTVDTRLI